MIIHENNQNEESISTLFLLICVGIISCIAIFSFGFSFVIFTAMGLEIIPDIAISIASLGFVISIVGIITIYRYNATFQRSTFQSE